MNFLHNVSIAGKLRFLLASTVVLVLVFAMVIPLVIGFKALENLEVSKLKNACEYKKSIISDYFKSCEDDVYILSINPFLIKALKDFSESFHETPQETCIKHFDTINAELKEYYNNEFITKYESTFFDKLPHPVYPADVRTAFMQYHFLVQNPNSLSEKYKMEYSGTYNGSYNILHANYHSFFIDLIERYGYYDLFLIDTLGYIVYSVFRKPIMLLH